MIVEQRFCAMDSMAELRSRALIVLIWISPTSGEGGVIGGRRSLDVLRPVPQPSSVMVRGWGWDSKEVMDVDVDRSCEWAVLRPSVRRDGIRMSSMAWRMLLFWPNDCTTQCY